MPSVLTSLSLALCLVLTVGGAGATPTAKRHKGESGPPPAILVRASETSGHGNAEPVERRWIHQLSLAELKAQAEVDDSLSQLWLAHRYHMAADDRRDAVAAYAWYTQALGHLYGDAALPIEAERNALARKLAWADIQEAERRAAELRMEGVTPAAIVALGRRLGAPDPTVRFAAAALLARVGPAAAMVIPALAWAVEQDPVSENRARAITALARIGSEATPTLVALLEDRAALRREGPDRLLGAVAALTVMGPAKLQSSRWPRRWGTASPNSEARSRHGSAANRPAPPQPTP